MSDQDTQAVGSADPVIAGFRPLTLPSSPFVLALLGGIAIVAMLMIAGGGLFVLAIGAVLTVFLVPIVARLERRGMGRTGATMVVIVVTVLVLVVAPGPPPGGHRGAGSQARP